MKVAESKTKSSAATTAAKTSNTPFFSKESQGASAFFGGETAEAEPFFSPRTIQPKLTIGKPNDHYEQQADAVADQVVAKLNAPTPSVPPTPKGRMTAASTSIGGTAVQAKCDHCEQEEKLQKKDEDITPVGEQVQMKPIFDSAAEPPPDDVQRKGEGNTEGGEASSDFSSQLSSSKGGGQPLPADTQQKMGSAMGADFSNVRIHTGREAAQMSDNISAQAFTHGNDVYFNEGKYNPSSTEGSHLLAHELTHTVQQGAAVQKKTAKETPSVPKADLTPVEPSVQKVANPAPVGAVSSETVDISRGTFSPSEKVKGEIDNETHGLKVKVKVGTVAEENVIKVKKRKDKYYSVEAGYLKLTNPWLAKVPGLVLRVDIKDDAVTGLITAAGGGTDVTSVLNKLRTVEETIGMGFKFGPKLPDTSNIVNKLEGGNLTLGFTNFTIRIGGFFDLGLNLSLQNLSTPIFDGSATMTVKGATGKVSVDNKAAGKLGGSGSLAITELKGFSGEINVKYDAATGNLDIHGKAAYTGDKLSGSIELVMTDLETANGLAHQAIAAAGGKPNVQEAAPPAPVPAPKAGSTKRALAGVGVLTFNLTKWFAGSVNVVVDGVGHITVIGKIAPPAEIILFEQKDWDKELFKLEAKAIYGIPVVGNLNVFANVSLHAIAKLGPAKIYNIEILGTYSTDPTVQKNIQIAASLNISAYAGLRLRAEGGAGLTLVGHDLKIGVGVNADVGVKAYADARPTIGYREPGEFYVSGVLEMVAQPMLGLSGDFFIELDAPWWSPLSDKKWIWPIASKEWPLTDPIGINASVKDYVLGSGKVPEVEMKKPEFDGNKFMSSMVDKQLPDGGGGQKDGKGEFKEDGSVVKPDVGSKKGGGKKDAGAAGAKPTGGKSAPPKQPEPPNAATQKKATEAIAAIAPALKAIKGPLSKADLNTKLAGIKGAGVTFDVQLKGKQWEVTPVAFGVRGGVKQALKIDAIVTANDKEKDKGNDTIAAALSEIDAEGKQKIADGEVTKADADQIAADVKRDHPTVIDTISVKDGGTTWQFPYIQKQEIPNVPKKETNTNKSQIEKYLNKIVTKDLPKDLAEGYESYNIQADDSFDIRRLPGKVEEGYVKLATDPRPISGDTSNPGFAMYLIESEKEGRTSNRISIPGKLTGALGGKKANHQAHHIIPDNVVREHNVMIMAREKINYNLDNGHNGLMMPCNDEGKLVTPNCAIHLGSHSNYDAKVRRTLDLYELQINNIEDEAKLKTLLNQIVPQVEDDYRTISKNSNPKIN